MFCYYCCKSLRNDCLSSHSREHHEKDARALKYGEKPEKPMYTNWQQYTLALDKVKPLMDKEAKKISMKERRELKAQQQRHTVRNEQ